MSGKDIIDLIAQFGLYTVICVALLYFLSRWFVRILTHKILEDSRIESEKQLQEIKQEGEKALEALKAQAAKEVFIHELQFKMEFEIYTELWEAVIDFGRSVERLRQAYDPESHKAKKINKLFDVHRESKAKLIDLVEKRQPFYAMEVYHSVTRILKIANVEWLLTLIQAAPVMAGVEGYKMSSPTPEMIEETVKRADGIMEEVHSISEAIRRRIHFPAA